MKMFRNELRTLVATEQEIYHHIKPNGSNFMVIDVLPELKPVYAVLDCGTTKLGCNFEFLLCETPELTVLLSSQHKFPSKSRMKQEFEREKTFVKEYVPIEKMMKEEG
jgi:hypothetical protein